jgi:hypothetical protein
LSALDSNLVVFDFSALLDDLGDVGQALFDCFDFCHSLRRRGFWGVFEWMEEKRVALASAY